ncbi:hypothetical protein EG831_01440 [bacterium]|nr:hypothetical protein [bacterium]
MDCRPITKKDRAVNLVVLAVFLAAVLSLVMAIVVFRLGWLAGVLLAFCAVFVLALAKWSVDTTGYECPSCKHRFEISLGTNLVSPHVWNKKLLRCPSCGRRGWANAVIKVRQPK